MKKFYVSLVGVLIGVYLEFEADSKRAVELYLDHEHRHKSGEWKLPWCAVYDVVPAHHAGSIQPTIIKAQCSKLYELDYDPGKLNRLTTTDAMYRSQF